MPRPSACELLRPSLVAFVHGEAHPETAKLLAHLKACPYCGREEEELRGTLQMIELARLPVQDELGPKSLERRAFWWASLVPHAWHILTGIAALFLLSVLFLGGREGSRKPLPPTVQPFAPRFFHYAALASPSFSGDEIDERLDSLEKGIQTLKASGKNRW
jgi:hypothetical protein